MLSGNREPSLRYLGSAFNIPDHAARFHEQRKYQGTTGKQTLANSRPKSKNRPKSQTPRKTERSWVGAIVFAAVSVAIVLAVAVVVNLAIGRVIHWDIVSVLGAIGFMFLAIGRKFKTI